MKVFFGKKCVPHGHVNAIITPFSDGGYGRGLNVSIIGPKILNVIVIGPKILNVIVIRPKILNITLSVMTAVT